MAQEPRGRGRPRKPKPRPDILGVKIERDLEIGVRENIAGVTITWLASIFRMNRETVQRRLGACPVIRRTVGDQPLFDIAQASAFLVKPKIDIADWVRSLRPADLPPYLQSEFWDAQNKRQKWEENAGDLWRTEKVVEVFADVFKTIKETVQLWTDLVERKQGLTGEQRALLTQMTDGLQDDLYKKLIEFSKTQQTHNTLAEMKDIDKAEPPRQRAYNYEKRPELV